MKEKKKEKILHAAPERHLHVAAFYSGPSERPTTRIQESRWHVGPDSHVAHMSAWQPSSRLARRGVSHVRCSSRLARLRRCACACEWSGGRITYIINPFPQRPAGWLSPNPIPTSPSTTEAVSRRGGAGGASNRSPGSLSDRPRPRRRRRGWAESNRAHGLAASPTQLPLRRWDPIRFVVNPHFSPVRIRAPFIICGESPLMFAPKLVCRMYCYFN